MITPDVGVPTYDQLLWPAVSALRELGGSGTIAEIDERVFEQEGFTPEQRGQLHGDGPRTEIEYRLAWARTHLKMMGLVDNSSRGVWTLLEAGWSVDETDIPAMNLEVRRALSAARAKRTPTPAGVGADPADGVAEPAAVGREAVYAAARQVLERGFGTDDSVFTPGRAVWTRENAEDLAFRLERPPPDASGTFLEKLRAELAGARDEVVQLAAEILFLHYLPASDIKGSTKRVGLRGVLAAASRPVTLPAGLDAVLDEGFMRVGVAFKTYRAQQVTWLAQVVAHVKAQPQAVVRTALGDPWEFRALVDAVPTTTAAGQRRTLLRLAFPGVFLDSLRADHLRAIVDTFADEVDVLTGDDERDFAAIRAVLEAREGPINFLRPPWVQVWGRDASTAEPGAAAYRPGWLVRGANVFGRNLVPEWLRDGYCSITLPDYPRVEVGLSRNALAGIVRTVEPELSPAQEKTRVALLDRFLTRMKLGDLVVTVNESRVHVGVLAGEVTWVAGVEATPAHHWRAVHWLDLDTGALHRSDLSDTAQDRLSGQAVVVELGEVAREIADLVGLDEIDTAGAVDTTGPFIDAGADVIPAELAVADVVPRPTTVVVETPPLEDLPVPTVELAGRLLVDHDWLVETVELLRIESCPLPGSTPTSFVNVRFVSCCRYAASSRQKRSMRYQRSRSGVSIFVRCCLPLRFSMIAIISGAAMVLPNGLNQAKP
ncbi:winged helix-turn-helix domain-containing protein [Protofrankia symbiont of Coriaria ruscifolia]|uniref:winged helix-turn-helix domain-containing protein n=1 Tax=Protofrankia symbiont of Coriaria ruscifolia TaxID=1306542 RepID=UPI0013EFB075|nr:winged helix-turn-helix domain-containing protein [Protofrankia symbiont of Coriaria ruscifolia]